MDFPPPMVVRQNGDPLLPKIHRTLLYDASRIDLGVENYTPTSLDNLGS
jgi:hypothetical protein